MGISGDKRTIGFEVSGDPAAALAMARQALESEQFTVAAVDAWNVTATRSTRAKALFLGAIAPFVQVAVNVRSRAEAGTTIVEIVQTPPGFAYAGGALGAKRSFNSIDRVCERLETAFREAGTLRSSTLG